MRTLALTLLASAALLAPSGASAATFINGTISGAMIGVTSSTPQIAAGSTFSSALTLLSGKTGGYSPLTLSTLITLPSFTASTGSAVSFTSAFGSYSGTVSSVSDTVAGSIRTLLVFGTGTFTPTGTLAGYDPTAASVTFNLLQTGGWGGSVTGGFQLSSPAASAIPEAATWGMMIAGAAMSGAALRRRRRVKVTVAA